MELLRLRERVAAGCGVDDEQRLVRRFRVVLRDAAFHLLEFAHEIDLRVQATRRIAKQELDVLTIRRLIGVVTKRRGISVVLAFDHLNSDAISPDAELLDRGRAERVRGG